MKLVNAKVFRIRMNDPKSQMAKVLENVRVKKHSVSENQWDVQDQDHMHSLIPGTR